MCGIAGYIRLDGGPADRDVLQAMCDVIEHRGPDGQGLLVEGPVALGMRRLAIIDVEGGDQPIHNEDRTVSIVYNGECYDFQRHRERLEARGHRFATHTDTETLVHLYEEEGLDFLESLRGMYAFALWDRPRDRFVFARDRIGKKPFHYYVGEAHFLFGSEIKSILTGMARLGIPRPEPDRQALVEYVGYGYVPDPRTAFEGISKLPPGSRLVLSSGRLDVSRYWEPSFAIDDSIGEDARLEQLEDLLDEAVRLRMISDVPLGAYLSGGIDSSTVCALMARNSARPIKTFSIGFEQEGFDELPFARRVAQHLGTDHHELVVRPDASQLIDGIVRQFDEPFADSSAIPTWYVSKMARDAVTVVLSGDGGDELFAGYSRYFRTARGLSDLMPLPLRRVLFGLPARIAPIGGFGRNRLLALASTSDERYLQEVTVGVTTWHYRLFRREFAASVETTDPAYVYRERLAERPDLDETSRRTRADILVYLPADIMTKVDRMSMMVSLEARAPLLDHEVVEFASTLPVTMKVRERKGKHLLRRLAGRLVPKECIERPKRGFAVPISRWFNDEWFDAANELLSPAVIANRKMFRPEFVAAVVDEHRRGRRDRSHFIWSLMMLELWFRAYVDDRVYS